MNKWTAFRIRQPLERLPKENFEEPHLGFCKYCKDDHNSPGPVKMYRHPVSLQLQPDNCSCLLCGQRYVVEYEDLEAFLGCPPSAHMIHEYDKIAPVPKYRSIDDEWEKG